MFAPHIPMRSEFKINRGILGVAIFVRTPPGLQDIVVSTVDEAETAISNMIEEEREKAVSLLANPHIIF